MAKTAIFENSRWLTVAIFKIASSPYLSRKSSDFNKIWSADAYFHFEDGSLTKYLNFLNSRWRTDAILKIVFGYISVPYWPIYAKFRQEIKNHMPIQVTCRQFKMADGSYFENCFISIFQPWLILLQSNLVHRYKFPFPACKFDKKIEIFKFKMADGRHIEYRCFGYISAPYWPINTKFGTQLKDHMPIYVTWPKLQFSQIQDADGRHFENSITSISQPRIIWFRSNLVGRWTFQFPR